MVQEKELTQNSLQTQNIKYGNQQADTKKRSMGNRLSIGAICLLISQVSTLILTEFFRLGENGSQDNPKNLATQTAFSNQKIQTYYEKLVRDAQKIKENKVIYQIVTVFRGNELMPRGYWLQASDSDPRS